MVTRPWGSHRTSTQYGRSKITDSGHSLEDLRQARGGDRWPSGIRISAYPAVRIFHTTSLPVVWVVRQDGLTQDLSAGTVHEPPGNIGSVLVGVGQERREPQLLKLPGVRVIADKNVDLLPPE